MSDASAAKASAAGGSHDLSVPVAFVTGAGSGIGAAVVERLAAAGYATVLVGRREAPLRATEGRVAALGGPPAVVMPADVADDAACENLIDKAVGRFGRLDVLVNNAGWTPLEPIAETDAETARKIFAVNALGPLTLIRRAWPTMTTQKPIAGRPSPCIVNVSSYATVDPFPGLGVYAGAKAALNLFTRACVNEGRGKGLRAFAIAPGAVETELLRSIVDEELLPNDATLSPGDVAAVIIQCVLGQRDAENGTTILLPSPQRSADIGSGAAG